MQIVKALAVLALAVLANLAVWGLPNRPQVIDKPWTGPILSVSFAPFRDGQSPLTETYPSPAQVEEDLHLLVGQVKGVRTYTSREGMQDVPRLAREFGLDVIHSAWLGTVLPFNAREVSGLIEAANAYPDTIKRVIVGNEVLLRGDLKIDALIAYIRQVKTAVKQPVSYADVWEFWLKNPELAQEVDFITIHILPYWEDDPVDIDAAIAHVRTIYRKMHAAFPDKPILIGETGWPSEGRTRNGAVPSLVNKARFMNKFFHLAAEEGFDYNFIEAFDQPWKAKLEGTVGANWGYYGIDRKLKFPMAGPIVENPRWKKLFAISSVLAAIPILWVAWRRRLGFCGLLTFAGLAQGLMSALVVAAHHGHAVSFVWWSLAAADGRVLLQAVLAMLILRKAAGVLAGDADGSAWPHLRTVQDALADMRRHGHLFLPIHWGSLPAWLVSEAALLGLTATALLQVALMVWDPRYRDFPIPDLLVPTFGLLAYKGIVIARGWRKGAGFGQMAPGLSFGLFAGGGGEGRDITHSHIRDEVWLVIAFVLGALAIAIRESLANLPHGPVHIVVNWEAMATAFMLLLMAIPYAATVLQTMARPRAMEAPISVGDQEAST